MFNLGHCDGVNIQQNHFEGEPFQKKILLQNMEKGQVKYKPSKEFDLIL